MEVDERKEFKTTTRLMKLRACSPSLIAAGPHCTHITHYSLAVRYRPYLSSDKPIFALHSDTKDSFNFFTAIWHTETSLLF